MLSTRRYLLLALSLSIASMAVQFFAFAHGEGHIYEQRHMFMNDLGKSMKAFRLYVKRGAGELAQLAAMAEDIAQNAPDLPDLFPQGTGIADNEESEAKQEIWIEWESFVAASNALVEPASELKSAFGTGDASRIAAAVDALGENGCRGCHSRFRLDTRQ